MPLRHAAAFRHCPDTVQTYAGVGFHIMSCEKPMDRKSWIRNLTIALAMWAGGASLGFGYSNHVAAASFDVPMEAGTETAKSTSPTDRELYFGILGRNLAVYAWLLCGLVSLGISTVVVTLFNGIYLGQTLALAGATGVSATSVAWLILPHGVLEVSAFLIAAALGILGPRLARAWLSSGDHIGAECRRLVRLWPVAALGALALVVAAGIETYVTVPLAEAQGVSR